MPTGPGRYTDSRLELRRDGPGLPDVRLEPGSSPTIGKSRAASLSTSASGHEIFGYPYGSERIHGHLRLPGGSGYRHGSRTGFLFASNFNKNSVSSTAGLGLKEIRQQEHHSERLQQLHAALRIRLVSSSRSGRFVIRGGYGMFLSSASRAVSPTHFGSHRRSSASSSSTTWATGTLYPRDTGSLPPAAGCKIGFDDGEPILVSTLDPEYRVRGLRAQMIRPDSPLLTPSSGPLNTQWEFRTKLVV